MKPLTAYQFHVRVGEKEFGFSRVSGLQWKSQYQEGGFNDRVRILPGPVRNSGVLRLERGVYAGENCPFYLKGECLGCPVTVEVWTEHPEMKPDKVYTLTGVVVKEWEVGELDAIQNAIIINRFELGYENIAVAPL